MRSEASPSEDVEICLGRSSLMLAAIIRSNGGAHDATALRLFVHPRAHDPHGDCTRGDEAGPRRAACHRGNSGHHARCGLLVQVRTSPTRSAIPISRLETRRTNVFNAGAISVSARVVKLTIPEPRDSSST